LISAAVLCLALNVYFEAGNQPIVGKIAVAQVVMNRVVLKEYPDTVCEVIHQGPTRTNELGEVYPIKWKCQFTWYCDGKSDEPLDSETWKQSLTIASLVNEKVFPDISGGASHYHATSVSPYWSKHLKRLMVVEDHVFYR
jgi:N-acetylmuramoyl-L-alanine amidase